MNLLKVAGPRLEACRGDDVKRAAALAGLLFMSAAGAGALTEAPEERPHVEAHLVADVASVGPGASFKAGVRLIHEPHWHTYYKEPGDSGMATRIAWELPAGWTAGEIEWPAFRKLVEPPLSTNVYDGAVTLAAPMKAPARIPGKEVVLRAKVSWLECADICLPGKAELSLTLPVEAAARPHPDAEALFARVPEAAEKPSLGFWAAVALAFLGGMLLNLMPCVLPVISFKILGFVQQAQGDPAAARRHGLLYAGGVVASFWALAGLLLALRAAGHGLGWGFQLQSPVVVGALALLFLALALNMFGVFEIGVSLTRLGGRGGGGAWSAAGSGVLAVVAATPCTAPFMGAALGYAVTRPAAEALSVFTALGVGMAWPYAALTASPRLLKLVPKPGAWMLTLKRVLGALLLGTALWLGSVLALQTGLVKSGGGEGLAWEPFSEARVTELRRAGRPVFVDFTAAWCLTCQVNERTALRDPEVLARFAALDVAPLKADWTHNDPAVTAALASHGRSSVPLYVYYPADPGAAPAILPALLTPRVVLEALRQTKE